MNLDVSALKPNIFHCILFSYIYFFHLQNFLKQMDIFYPNFISSKHPNFISSNLPRSEIKTGNFQNPPSFSLDEHFHVPNGFRKGGICIAVISSNRTEYLNIVLNSLFQYIQKHEPNLTYNLVWIDTASSHQGQLNIELSRRFHFDRKIFLSTRSKDKQVEGISTPNILALSLCSKNDFFMPLEEDFQLVSTPKIGFLQKTIDILNAAPHSLMGIVFKNTEPRSKKEKTLVVNVGNENYTIYYGLDRGSFSYTNGAGIYRMQNIREYYKDGVIHSTMFEICISRVVNKFGHYFGFVDFIDNCTKEPGDCYGVFHHIGLKSTWR